MLLTITLLAPIAVSVLIGLAAWRHNRKPTHVDPTNPAHFPRWSRSAEHGEWVDTIQGERK